MIKLYRNWNPVSSTTNLLNKFELFISVEKKLSQETINKHLNNLDFFLNVYLNRYERISPTAVSESEITDFLGNFYIRKVIDGTKSGLLSFIPSIKKFYRFLLEIGEIDEEQYTDIYDACRNPNRYRRRFENYFNLDFNAPDKDERFNRWLMWEDYEENEENEENGFKSKFNDQYVQKILQFPYNLQKTIEKNPINPNATSFLHDFHIFLDYCSQNPTMKVTKTNGFIQRKHIHNINHLFQTREKLKQTINQPEVKRIHLFYNLAISFNFFLNTTKSTLQPTPILNGFKKLSPSNQLAWIIHVIWNQIQWKNLLKPNSGGRPEWSQTKRINFEEAFADATADYQYKYPEFILQYQKNENTSFMDTFLYQFGVIPERILPAFKDMGYIQFTYKEFKEKKEQLNNQIIEQITISSQGKEVFRALLEKKS